MAESPKHSERRLLSCHRPSHAAPLCAAPDWHLRDRRDGLPLVPRERRMTSDDEDVIWKKYAKTCKDMGILMSLLLVEPLKKCEKWDHIETIRYAATDYHGFKPFQNTQCRGSRPWSGAFLEGICSKNPRHRCFKKTRICIFTLNSQLNVGGFLESFHPSFAARGGLPLVARWSQESIQIAQMAPIEGWYPPTNMQKCQTIGA